jgi:hypothetical protein
MNSQVLYCGDTRIDQAASYLAGLLHRASIGFDYLDSDTPFAPPGEDCRCVIFSDYPASRLNEADMKWLVTAVRGGMGLIMLGGWETFHGLGGNWDATPLADVLPVTMLDEDDRVNSSVPLLVEAVADHPVLAGLPWQSPPAVGGYNRIQPRPEATELLRLRAMQPAREDGGKWRVAVGEPEPLLVVGSCGAGRTAALATDVAPHWVGTLVDWGEPRITADVPGGGNIEVGCHYAQFFTQLVQWSMGAIG